MRANSNMFLYVVALTMTLIHTPALFGEPEKPTTQQSPGAEAAIAKISLDDFEKLRTEKDAVVLDVRTPKEFAAGHVPGAINIDWRSRDFADQVGKLDKSKSYLVHCYSGVRSTSATKKMAGMGFDHLMDFSGGWSAYEKAGKTVEK